MKRFQSRLDSLQRLRNQQEQLAAAEAVAGQQRYAAARNTVNERRVELDSTGVSMRQMDRTNLGAALFQGMMRLYQRQLDELELAQQACQVASADAERAVDAWTDARKELKTVEQTIDVKRQEHRRIEMIHEEHRQQENTARKFFQRSGSDNGVSER